MAHSDIVLTSAVLLLRKPVCYQCGTPMTLLNIDAVSPHMMQRTFECQTCDRAKDVSALPPKNFVHDWPPLLQGPHGASKGMIQSF